MPNSLNPFKLWSAYSEAAMMAATTAVASATTIASRLAMLGTAGFATDPKEARREATRMVAEKVYASVESATAIGKAALDATRSGQSQQQLAMAPVKIGMAALKPYTKRAKRNAARLSSRGFK